MHCTVLGFTHPNATVSQQTPSAAKLYATVIQENHTIFATQIHRDNKATARGRCCSFLGMPVSMVRLIPDICVPSFAAKFGILLYNNEIPIFDEVSKNHQT